MRSGASRTIVVPKLELGNERKQVMKIIAILVNIALFSLIAYIIATEGLPKKADVRFILSIFLLLTPIINLLYIFFWRPEESWLTLYFKRKASEEKKKIEELANKK